jgi:ABC-2 type transport system permease protein
MMSVPFRILLRGALRDRVSLAWAIVFPLVLLLALGFTFPTPSYRSQLLVGMLALSVMFFSLYGIAFESLAQRNQGVYKLLRATPYHTMAFVMNLTLARGLVALLSAGLVAIVGVLAFHVAVTPTSILLLVPVLVLATLCFTCIGLTVGNLSQNETQVAGLNNLVTLPMIFTSEAFYSLGAAPAWVHTLSRVLPLSHVLDGVRAALAGSPSSIISPLLFVLGYTLLALALAVLTFRWDPDAAPLRRSARAAHMSA